ncbi:MAG: formate/nitrite transporter family protein [Chthoniobacterales bacterium]
MTKGANARKKTEEEIVQRTAPPGEVVYHAIYREGEHELKRKTGELAFSGLAAGLSMGFSLVAEALLQERLPDTPWRPLVAKLGYSVGFLIVILGRQQLFTKNTLTVILPVLREKKLSTVGTVGKLWATVFLMNLIGAFAFAWLAARSPAFPEEARAEFLKVAQTAIHPGFGELFARGIVAGWLIALMVWLLPFAESAHIWVIIILAYLIGIAELPHIIAGSVEAFYCVSAGLLAFSDCVTHYLVPVLLGNVIGGVALVAFGAHAEFIEASDAG